VRGPDAEPKLVVGTDQARVVIDAIESAVTELRLSRDWRGDGAAVRSRDEEVAASWKTRGALRHQAVEAVIAGIGGEDPGKLRECGARRSEGREDLALGAERERDLVIGRESVREDLDHVGVAASYEVGEKARRAVAHGDREEVDSGGKLVGGERGEIAEGVRGDGGWKTQDATELRRGACVEEVGDDLERTLRRGLAGSVDQVVDEVLSGLIVETQGKAGAPVGDIGERHFEGREVAGAQRTLDREVSEGRVAEALGEGGGSEVSEDLGASCAVEGEILEETLEEAADPLAFRLEDGRGDAGLASDGGEVLVAVQAEDVAPPEAQASLGQSGEVARGE